MGSDLLVYTHPECSYSTALKDELDAAGTAYAEVDLARHPDEWAKVEQLAGGERITPVMVEGDFVSVGFHGVG